MLHKLTLTPKNGPAYKTHASAKRMATRTINQIRPLEGNKNNTSVFITSKIVSCDDGFIAEIIGVTEVPENINCKVEEIKIEAPEAVEEVFYERKEMKEENGIVNIMNMTDKPEVVEVDMTPEEDLDSTEGFNYEGVAEVFEELCKSIEEDEVQETGKVLMIPLSTPVTENIQGPKEICGPHIKLSNAPKELPTYQVWEPKLTTQMTGLVSSLYKEIPTINWYDYAVALVRLKPLSYPEITDTLTFIYSKPTINQKLGAAKDSIVKFEESTYTTRSMSYMASGIGYDLSKVIESMEPKDLMLEDELQSPYEFVGDTFSDEDMEKLRESDKEMEEEWFKKQEEINEALINDYEDEKERVKKNKETVKAFWGNDKEKDKESEKGQMTLWDFAQQGKAKRIKDDWKKKEEEYKVNLQETAKIQVLPSKKGVEGYKTDTAAKSRATRVVNMLMELEGNKGAEIIKVIKVKDGVHIVELHGVIVLCNKVKYKLLENGLFDKGDGVSKAKVIVDHSLNPKLKKQVKALSELSGDIQWDHVVNSLLGMTENKPEPIIEYFKRLILMDSARKIKESVATVVNAIARKRKNGPSLIGLLAATV